MRLFVRYVLLCTLINVARGIKCFKGIGKVENGLPDIVNCDGTTWCVTGRGLVGENHGQYDCGNSADPELIKLMDYNLPNKVCTEVGTQKNFERGYVPGWVMCCNWPLCNYPTTAIPTTSTTTTTTANSTTANSTTSPLDSNFTLSETNLANGMLYLNVSCVIALLGVILVF